MGNLYELIIMSRASVSWWLIWYSARNRLPFLSRVKLQRKLRCLIKIHYSILVKELFSLLLKTGYILVILLIIIVKSNFYQLSFNESPRNSYYWHYNNIHIAFWTKDFHLHRWKNKSTKSRVTANLHYFI